MAANLIVAESKRSTRLPGILRAALRLFVEKGVEAATTKEIAKRARVSEGALYRHFKSKEALAWHLFSAHLERFSREIERRVGAERGVKDKIAAVVRACFEAFDEDRDLFSFLILSEHREFHKYPANGRHLGFILLDILKEGQKSGKIGRMNAELMTAMALGTIIRACLFKVYGRIATDMRDCTDEVVDSLWRAFKK